MTTTPSPAAVAAIEAGFLDECEIRDPGRDTYTPATNSVVHIPGALGYAGACSVAAAGTLTGGGRTSHGGEPETERAYWVSIPRNATPAPGTGQIVTITAVNDEGDPELLTKTLLVGEVRYGTRMARRILRCTLIETVTR